MQILIGSAGNGALPAAAVDGMHRLRYHVFRERLHWDIPAADYRERDCYDDCNPVFVLARSARTVVGCCRLLPTTGAYMLKDTFPQLLGAGAPPVDPGVWEISRFAVAKDARPGFGFSSVPAAMICELVRYARYHDIRSYVFVTTTGFERLLRRMGVHIERFAEPMQVGIEKSVALWMHNDVQTIRASGAAAANAPFASAAAAVRRAA